MNADSLRVNAEFEKCVKKESIHMQDPNSHVVVEDTGYPQDGRADKDSYLHDGRADKTFVLIRILIRTTGITNTSY